MIAFDDTDDKRFILSRVQVSHFSRHGLFVVSIDMDCRLLRRKIAIEQIVRNEPDRLAQGI